MGVLKSVRLIGAIAAGAGWYISPHGFNLYRTSPGDTFESLAQTYLGDAARAFEIYNEQSPAWRAARGNDPSNLETGAELYMPQEAINSAINAGLADPSGAGEPPTAARSGKVEVGGTDVLNPSTPSNVVPFRPSPVKPAPPPPPPASGDSFLARFGKTILITSGLSIAVGTIAAVGYHSAHAKPARRRNPKKKSRGRKGFVAAWRAAAG